MNCENCNHSTDRPDPAFVPLVAVEGQSYRRERTLRGTVIVFCVALLVIALLVGVFGYFAYQLHVQSMEKVEAINRYWIDFISQYEFEGDYTEYSQDGKGLNIIGNGNGVTAYGPEAENISEDDATEGR